MPIAGSNISNVMNRRPGSIAIKQKGGQWGQDSGFKQFLGAPKFNNPATGSQPAAATPAAPPMATTDQKRQVWTRNPLFAPLGLGEMQTNAIMSSPTLRNDFDNWYYNDPTGYMNQAAINGGTWDPAMTPNRFMYAGTQPGGFVPPPPAIGDDLATLFQEKITALEQLLANGGYQPLSSDQALAMGQSQQGQGQGQGMTADMMALLMSLIGQNNGGGGGQGQGGYPNAGYIYGG